jgi:hypothetical protein
VPPPHPFQSISSIDNTNIKSIFNDDSDFKQFTTKYLNVDSQINKELQIVNEYVLLSSSNKARDSGARQKIAEVGDQSNRCQ